jgi:prepilin-type N-terminal cleavage/methylation domain-containing protein
MTRAQQRHAFTLIELMLAMVFIAMLTMTLYTALRVGIRARASAAGATDSVRATAIVANLVRQDLESVLPPTGTYAGPFIGVKDDVQFCTIGRDDALDESPLAEGLRRVELVLRTDVGSPALVRRVTRNLQPASTEEFQEEVLCRDVRAFGLQYWDGSMWQESWDSTTVGDVLPMAVGITMEIGDPARPDAPPRKTTIVVPLACAQPATSTMGGL